MLLVSCFILYFIGWLSIRLSKDFKNKLKLRIKFLQLLLSPSFFSYLMIESTINYLMISFYF